jgi:hypothetical protein
VEQGNHQELYARRGLYWRLSREQQGAAPASDTPKGETNR